MRTVVSMFFSLGFLAACASPQDQAAQAQRQMDFMIQVYGPACEKLGYAPKTDPWRNCILQLSAKDDFVRYQRYPDYSYPFWWRHPRYWP